MPPPRAFAWPPSIYEDAAVLSVDPSGRFILCRACLEHYDKCGGKTPKPVVMNARYRTRAWDTHKRRTRAHRMWPAYNKDLQIQAPQHQQLRVNDYRPASMAANSWMNNEHKEASCALPTSDSFALQHQDFCSGPRLEMRPEPAMIAQLHPRRHSDAITALSPSDRQISLREHDASAAIELERLAAEPEPEAEQEHHTDQTSTTPTSCGHQLRNILNPAACDQHEETTRRRDDLELSDGLVLSPWAQEKLRRSQLRPCCDGRSETHQLYWKTLRQLFSDPNKRSSTSAGDF